jgi:hypothetical protein
MVRKGETTWEDLVRQGKARPATRGKTLPPSGKKTRVKKKICQTCRKPFIFSAGRGCCSVCYPKHSLAVRQGKTTWQQLEREGKTLPFRGNPGLRLALERRGKEI